jgi:glutaconate CoA-transferase subunit A
MNSMSSQSEPDLPDYRKLRARLSERDRGLRDKVMSLRDAIATIKDGEHVAIGGNTFSRTPFAAVWELVRQRRSRLSVSRSITSAEGDFLLAGDCVDKYMTSWFSQGLPWGLSRVMRDYVENGKVVYEEWSHMSLGMMYRAGAMGIPFLPTRVMMGSGMPAALATRIERMTCPYSGDPLLLLPALNPHVALIHVQRADKYGNAQYDGLPFMDADMALAADRVILTTERIIDNDEIRAAPDQTRIPFMTVDAVVEIPFGAAPHECAGCYDASYKSMDAYADLTRRGGTAAALDFMRDHIYGASDWNGFLQKLGIGGKK